MTDVNANAASESRVGADVGGRAIDPVLLGELARQSGRSVADLQAALASMEAPTIAAAVAEFLKGQSDRTRDTYGYHLKRLVNGFGPCCDALCRTCRDPETGFECRCRCAQCRDSRITIPALGDIHVSSTVLTSALVNEMGIVARRHAVWRGLLHNRKRALRGLPSKQASGKNAQETAIQAMRSLLKSVKKHCDASVGQEVPKPRRDPREKRPLRRFELAELHHVTANGGNDPELDTLLLDFAIATGARCGGAIGLVVGRVHAVTQIVEMKEKGGITAEMPVSADLIERLIAHATSRGGARCDPTSSCYVPDSSVFWSRHGRKFVPLGGRRFDNLAHRWQTTLDWARDEQLTFHHIRHTMGAIIATEFGPQYKRRYLRHGDSNVTDMYGRCTLPALASALSALLEFDHPLVHGIAERERATLERLGLATTSTDAPESANTRKDHR
jgi:integrase